MQQAEQAGCGSCGCSVSASAVHRSRSWRCSAADSSRPWKAMFELGRRPRAGSVEDQVRCERAQRKNTRRACSWRARLAGLAVVARNASTSLAGDQLPSGDRGPRCGQVAGEVTDRGEVDLQGAVGPGAGSGPAGSVARLAAGHRRTLAAAARNGCWCLGDAPADRRACSGLGGGVGRQASRAAGEEGLQRPGERAGGGAVGSVACRAAASTAAGALLLLLASTPASWCSSATARVGDRRTSR